MAQNTEQFEHRQAAATSLAEAHATWYREFGHRYLFMFANLAQLSQEQATPVATLILLNDIASKLDRITRLLEGIKLQGALASDTLSGKVGGSL